MKAVSEFQITGMTISGFKCFEMPTELVFGNPTVITGGNGRGKSSIADAIAFAVTGLPFLGKRGIDRLHNERSPELYVALRLVDGNDQPHELVRIRRKDEMTITYDGYNIRQRDLSEMFGERDVFLSIFNPLYFIEELGDDGRKLLERYLPAVTHEQVLAELNESVRASLKDESMPSPEFYMSKLREDVRELERDLIYLTGQKDLRESQREQAEKARTELTDKLDQLRSECEILSLRRFDGLDTEAMQENLTELSTRYSELAKDGPDIEDTSELDEQLRKLSHDLGTRSAEKYQEKYTQHIAELTAQLGELGRKYRQEEVYLSGFVSGAVCPACRREVTEADVDAVHQSIKNIIGQVLAEGKETRQKLNELQALENKTRDTFLQFQKDDVEAIQEKISSLQKQKEENAAQVEKLSEAHSRELESLQAQIQSLVSDLEYGNLSQEEYDRLGEYKDAIRDCNARLEAMEQQDAAAVDYDARLAEIQGKIAEKKKLLANAALYMGKRAELILSRLKMNRVAISLFDVVKTTGEVKDVFKFTYNGRRYDRLSLSEKIRAGMELSELMKRLTGRNYPVFADNMESVDDLSNVRPTGQVIMAKCVHKAELCVRPVNRASQTENMAA